MQAVDSKVDKVDTKVETLDKKVEDVNVRVTNLESMIQSAFKELQDEMYGSLVTLTQTQADALQKASEKLAKARMLGPYKKFGQ